MNFDERLKKLERERRRGDPRHILLKVETADGPKKMTVDEFILTGLDFLTDAHIIQGNDPEDVKKLCDYMAPGSVIK